jgi:small-conductance mechanosensitive channel
MEEINSQTNDIEYQNNGGQNNYANPPSRGLNTPVASAELEEAKLYSRRPSQILQRKMQQAPQQLQQHDFMQHSGELQAEREALRDERFALCERERAAIEMQQYAQKLLEDVREREKALNLRILQKAGNSNDEALKRNIKVEEDTIHNVPLLVEMFQAVSVFFFFYVVLYSISII